MHQHHLPLRGGQQLWQPQPVQLPDLSAPEFAGPLSAANWDQCSLSGQCAAMDIPTPNPSHADPTTPGASRSQLLGTPAIAASVTQATIVAGPPSIQGQNTITISNAGSSLLAWRATSSAPWLKVSAYQGIALGNDLGAWTSTLTIFADDATGIRVNGIVRRTVAPGTAHPALVGVGIELVELDEPERAWLQSLVQHFADD